jgi:hypothetical protein
MGVREHPSRSLVMAEGSVSGNSSSSKSLMWMTAALFAGMAVLLVGGLFLAGRVVRSFGIRASLGGPQTVQTKQGTYRLEREKEVGPAVPLYPHASLVVPDDDAAVLEAKDAEKGIGRVTYESDDSRDFIDKWYQDHLPQVFERHSAETPLTADLTSARVQDNDIAFSATKNGHTRIVVLSEIAAGTKISIVRMDKPEAAASDSAPPQQ